MKKTARPKKKAAKPPAKKQKNDGKAKNDKIYVFRLFVSGSTPRSLKAIDAIKHLCEEYAPNEYDLHIVDIYQRPELLTEEQIIAVPTLVKTNPNPKRKFIGDLSDLKSLIEDLGFEPAAASAS